MTSKTNPIEINYNADAIDEYERLQAHIRKLASRIDWLLEEADKADGSNPMGHNWGAVGDLVDIARDLESAESALVDKANRRTRRQNVIDARGRKVQVVVPSK